jgi:hypothetical protein
LTLIERLFDHGPMEDHDLERARRSLAMLQPGSPARGMSREDVIDLIEEVQATRSARRAARCHPSAHKL